MKDFAALKKHFNTSRNEKLKVIVDKAQRLLQFIAENQLEHAHFTRKYLPNTLSKIAEADFNVNFDTKWVQNLGQEPLYTKTQK